MYSSLDATSKAVNLHKVMPVVPWHVGHQCWVYHLGSFLDKRQRLTRIDLPGDWLQSHWHHVTAISQPSQDAHASPRCAEGSVPGATQTEVIPLQLMTVGLYLQFTAYIKF